jgi:hypothetical protein
MPSRPKATLVALSLGLALTLTLALGGVATASGTPPSFLSQLKVITQVGSTVPPNGDVNPYGIETVPQSAGSLVAGDTLISNFNDKKNVQGTGTTLVEVSPTGTLRLFARLGSLPAGMSCPGGIGLTTALGILPGGWVIVGSLPTVKGGALPALQPAGCMVVLNDEGTPVETITNRHIVGPWDMAVSSTPTSAELFISNALGGNTSTDRGTPIAGNCTVVRLDLRLSPSAPPVLTGTTVIGTGYPWRANKTALVLAPTGLALGANGTLFVDDSQTNSVSAIPHALTRTSALSASTSRIDAGGALNAPLGMTLAPNGNLVIVNGNDGNAVEMSPRGRQVAVKTLVKNGAGDLFGIIPDPASPGFLFVNDGKNTLEFGRV